MENTLKNPLIIKPLNAYELKHFQGGVSFSFIVTLNFRGYKFQPVNVSFKW